MAHYTTHLYRVHGRAVKRMSWNRLRLIRRVRRAAI